MDLTQYKIEKNSKAPLYLQVEDIIGDILSRKPYIEGAKLPNELEISEKLCVSRNTVRKAMDSLLHKNLIIRKKNRGTFKNLDDQRIKTTLNNWYSFNEDMKQQNKEFKSFEHTVSTCKASLEVSRKLEINQDSQIVKLLRVKGYLEPEFYVESYFHPDLDILTNELEENRSMQLYQFLEKKFDINIVLSEEEISAIMPTNEARKLLNLKEKIIPIMIRKMLIYDKDNNKIAYSIGYYLANRFAFNLNISR